MSSNSIVEPGDGAVHDIRISLLEDRHRRDGKLDPSAYQLCLDRIARPRDDDVALGDHAVGIFRAVDDFPHQPPEGRVEQGRDDGVEHRMVDVVPAGDHVDRDVVRPQILRRRRRVPDVLMSRRSAACVAFVLRRERLEAVVVEREAPARFPASAGSTRSVPPVWQGRGCRPGRSAACSRDFGFGRSM